MDTEIKKVITIDTGQASASIRDLMTRVEELNGKLAKLDDTTLEYSDTQDELNSALEEIKDTLGEQGIEFGQIEDNLTKFGTKYKDVFKDVLKASSDNLESLNSTGISLKTFPAIFNAVKAGGVGAFTAIKTAIASTGIGLLVVAVGEIVAHWEDITSWVGNAAKNLGIFGNELETKVAPTAGQLAEHFADIDENVRHSLEMMKIMGATEVDILKAQLDAIQNRAYELRDAMKIRDLTDDELELLRKLETTDKIRIQNQIKEAELREEQRKKREEEANAEKERENTRHTTRMKNLKEEKKAEEKYTGAGDPAKFFEEQAKWEEEYQKQQQRGYEEILKNRLDLFNKSLEEEQQLRENKLKELTAKGLQDPTFTGSEKLNEQLAIETEYYNARIQLINDYLATGEMSYQEQVKWTEDLKKLNDEYSNYVKVTEAKISETQKKESDKRKKQKFDEAGAVFDAMGGLFSSLGSLMEEDSKQAKAMNIMSVIMDTAMGITKIWAHAFDLGPIAGPIVAGINTATMIATGIASIKQITSANKNSGAGSLSENVPQNTSIAVTPLLDQQRDMTNMNMTEAATSISELPPQRVYVLESDITETQKKVAVTENNAKF